MDDPPEPVYENVERQPSVSSPGATAGPRPPAWETHTDTGSGRPYYYNPDTGVTTWESPFEAGEGIASPATSPASVGSRESLETDWGQYWDEESRRVFFYNPLTGETVWEDETEDEPEDELEMQPGLSPLSPRDQRVRGRGLARMGGVALRPQTPPPALPQPASQLLVRGVVWSKRAGPRVRTGSETLRLGLCSLQPPTPETDYPESLTSYPEEDYSPVGSFSEPRSASPLATPPGWSLRVNPDGQTLYTNHFTQEQVRAAGRYGQTAPRSFLQVF